MCGVCPQQRYRRLKLPSEPPARPGVLHFQGARLTGEVPIEARCPRDGDTVFAEALGFGEMTETMQGPTPCAGVRKGDAREASPVWSMPSCLGPW